MGKQPLLMHGTPPEPLLSALKAIIGYQITYTHTHTHRTTQDMGMVGETSQKEITLQALMVAF
jgi:hypothetical protein